MFIVDLRLIAHHGHKFHNRFSFGQHTRFDNQNLPDADKIPGTQPYRMNSTAQDQLSTEFMGFYKSKLSEKKMPPGISVFPMVAIPL